MKKETNTQPALTIEQYTNIIKFMFVHRNYKVLEDSNKLLTLEAPSDFKFGGHLLHFPLNECNCEGLHVAIVPIRGIDVKTKKIGKFVNKILNSVFN